MFCRWATVSLGIVAGLKRSSFCLQSLRLIAQSQIWNLRISCWTLTAVSGWLCRIFIATDLSSRCDVIRSPPPPSLWLQLTVFRYFWNTFRTYQIWCGTPSITSLARHHGQSAIYWPSPQKWQYIVFVKLTNDINFLTPTNSQTVLYVDIIQLFYIKII